MTAEDSARTYDPPWVYEWRAEVVRGHRFGYRVTFHYGPTEAGLFVFRLTAWGAARCARHGIAKREKIEARTARRWVIRL